MLRDVGAGQLTRVAMGADHHHDLDGLGLLVAENAGHFPQSTLGAGEGVAELGHAMNHRQQMIAVKLLVGLAGL